MNRTDLEIRDVPLLAQTALEAGVVARGSEDAGYWLREQLDRRESEDLLACAGVEDHAPVDAGRDDAVGAGHERELQLLRIGEKANEVVILNHDHPSGPRFS